jgi:hypothetical protein
MNISGSNKIDGGGIIPPQPIDPKGGEKNNNSNATTIISQDMATILAQAGQGFYVPAQIIPEDDSRDNTYTSNNPKPKNQDSKKSFLSDMVTPHTTQQYQYLQTQFNNWMDVIQHDDNLPNLPGQMLQQSAEIDDDNYKSQTSALLTQNYTDQDNIKLNDTVNNFVENFGFSDMANLKGLVAWALMMNYLKSAIWAAALTSSDIEALMQQFKAMIEQLKASADAKKLLSQKQAKQIDDQADLIKHEGNAALQLKMIGACLQMGSILVDGIGTIVKESKDAWFKKQHERKEGNGPVSATVLAEKKWINSIIPDSDDNSLNANVMHKAELCGKDTDANYEFKYVAKGLSSRDGANDTVITVKQQFMESYADRVDNRPTNAEKGRFSQLRDAMHKDGEYLRDNILSKADSDAQKKKNDHTNNTESTIGSIKEKFSSGYVSNDKIMNHVFDAVDATGHKISAKGYTDKKGELIADLDARYECYAGLEKIKDNIIAHPNEAVIRENIRQNLVPKIINQCKTDVGRRAVKSLSEYNEGISFETLITDKELSDDQKTTVKLRVLDRNHGLVEGSPEYEKALANEEFVEKIFTFNSTEELTKCAIPELEEGRTFIREKLNNHGNEIAELTRKKESLDQYIVSHDLKGELLDQTEVNRKVAADMLEFNANNPEANEEQKQIAQLKSEMNNKIELLQVAQREKAEIFRNSGINTQEAREIVNKQADVYRRETVIAELLEHKLTRQFTDIIKDDVNNAKTFFDNSIGTNQKPGKLRIARDAAAYEIRSLKKLEKTARDTKDKIINTHEKTLAAADETRKAANFFRDAIKIGSQYIDLQGDKYKLQQDLLNKYSEFNQTMLRGQSESSAAVLDGMLQVMQKILDTLVQLQQSLRQTATQTTGSMAISTF